MSGVLRAGPFANSDNFFLNFVPFKVMFPVNAANKQIDNWRWRYWKNVNDEFEDPQPFQLLTAPLNGLVVVDGSVVEIDPIAFSSIYFSYMASTDWSFTGQISASILEGFAALNVRQIAIDQNTPLTIVETYASQTVETFGTPSVASVDLDLSTIVFPASKTPVFIYIEARAAGDGGPRPANSLIELAVSNLN